MNRKPLKTSLVVLLVVLTGCNLPIMGKTVEEVADVPIGIPTATPMVIPRDIPTESSIAQPPVPIAYYYFVEIEGESPLLEAW